MTFSNASAEQAFLLFLPLTHADEASTIQAGDEKIHVILEAAWESGMKLHGGDFSGGIKQQKPPYVRQGEHLFHQTEMSSDLSNLSHHCQLMQHPTRLTCF